jgi:hypothetical protein
LRACALALGLAIVCTLPTRTERPSATPSETPVVMSVAPSAASSTALPTVGPTPIPSTRSSVRPTSTAPPTPAGSVPRPTASPSVRVLGLGTILKVRQPDRFETFGGQLIRLESVWSPADLGLGGTCLPSDAWLECGLEDWIIQPTQEAQPGDYDGPRLDLFFGPGVRERLGRNLRPGAGPLEVVGHFGDPASQDCRLENRDACRDRFVVTAIEVGS